MAGNCIHAITFNQAINCANIDTKTLILNKNSIIRLQPKCSAFVDITKIHAEPPKLLNISDNSHPVLMPCNYCGGFTVEIPVHDLKPFISKNISWFTIETIITVIIIAIALTIYLMCRRRKQSIEINLDYTTSSILNVSQLSLSRIISKLRPRIRSKSKG